MKNILNKFLLVALFFGIVLSCKEESNLPSGIKDGVNSRVLFNYPDNAYLKVTDLANAAMKFDLYSQNKDIDHIDFTVSYKNTAGYAYPAQLLFTVKGSDFSGGKVTITKTAAEMIAPFALPGGIADLLPGESFTFAQKAYLTDGRSYDATNVAPSIGASGTTSFTQPFTVFIACPSLEVADMVGDWLVTRDDFGFLQDYSIPISVIAGPGATQYTIKNLAGGSGNYNVVIDFAVPGKGDLTIAKQKAWECGDLGCTFGTGSVQGNGIGFSCAGFMLMDLQHTVSAGSFGTFRLELTKQ